MKKRSAVLVFAGLLAAAAPARADEFVQELNAASVQASAAASLAAGAAREHALRNTNLVTDRELNPWIGDKDTVVRDYTTRFDLRPRGLDIYTAYVRVYLAKAATARVQESATLISDPEEGIGQFRRLTAEASFGDVGLVRVTLVNERTGETQTAAGAVTLELSAITGDSAGFYDFSGKFKDEKDPASVRLEMPDLKFPQFEVVLLPFVTGEFYTCQNVDATLKQTLLPTPASDLAYTVSGLDFDQLIEAEAHSKAAPLPIGWRHNYWEPVEYVPLTKAK